MTLKELVDSVTSLPSWLLVALLLALSIALFAPPPLQLALGLSSMPATARAWLGAAWTLTAAIGIALVGSTAFQRIRQRRAAALQARETQRAGTERLKSLTPAEREILRGYIANNTRSQALEINSGVVADLERHGIVWRASNAGLAFMFFAYNISDWAWDYLHRHPEVLEGDLPPEPRRKPHVLRGRA